MTRPPRPVTAKLAFRMNETPKRGRARLTAIHPSRGSVGPRSTSASGPESGRPDRVPSVRLHPLGKNAQILLGCLFVQVRLPRPRGRLPIEAFHGPATPLCDGPPSVKNSNACYPVRGRRKWAAKPTPRSEWNDGYGTDSGPSGGDSRRRAFRPIEPVAVVTCYVRSTSIPGDHLTGQRQAEALQLRGACHG
jgi:hypothetical protein